MKIEIKNRFTGSIIFEHDEEKNSILLVVKLAIESSADLSGANLSGANLSDADLRSADLSAADLSGVIINQTTFGFVINCPEFGLFTAFKKASGKIVKLLISEDSKRSSATSFKCRCSKATVLTIENMDGSDSGLTKISSDYNSSFIYEVGKTVEVTNFDENRWNECSTGIHFFMSREMAKQYI